MLRLPSLLGLGRSLTVARPRPCAPVLYRGYSDTFKTLLDEISASIKPRTTEAKENTEKSSSFSSKRNDNEGEDFGNRGRRDMGEREERSYGNDRSYGGERRGGDRGDRGDRGYGSRFNDRSERGDRGDRGGDKFGDKFGGDRFGGDKYGGDRGFGGNRSYGDRDRGMRRGYGDRNERGGDRDFGDSRGPMNFGNKLDSIDWKTTELSPVDKVIKVESEDVNKMTPEEASQWRATHTITIKGAGCPNPIATFDNAPFPPEIKKMLKVNYSAPTPIQAQGWALAFSGKDMVGSSQTGSGKTLGFVLPALMHIQAQLKLQPHRWTDGPIALVLAPTRELAVQIIAESNAYVRKLGLKAAAVYGGSQRGGQQQELRQGVHLLVATPGRLIDFLADGTTNLRRVSYVVLDEADRMLDMGFEPQIRQIMSQLRPDRQTLMWSATWPMKVQALAYEFFNDPITIHVGSTELRANPNVTQHVHIMSEREKQNKATELVKSLHKDGPSKVLIFCATQEMADRLSYTLQDQGFNRTASIHGGKSQGARMQMLAAFKDGNIHTLVATDVAARGLDINNIQHVINYDFPNEIEDYIHRIGRTGRAGKTGNAHTFLSHEKHPGKLVPHLIKVLKEANQVVSEDLRAFGASSWGGGGSSYGGGGRRYFGRR